MKHTLICNHKYSALESLLDKKGNFNTALSKNINFKNLDIYKEILNKTKCLNVFGNIPFVFRFYFLYNQMSLQYCKICNQPFICFPKQQRRFSLCNHKQNYNKSKITKLIAINNNEKISKFIASLSNKILFESNEQFTQHLNELFAKKQNYAFCLTTKQYFNFYHDLIIKTQNIIPIRKDNNFNIVERLYIIYNNLTEKPKCRYCHTNNVQFLNRFAGYADNCHVCTIFKIQDNWKNKIHNYLDQNIDKNKYEIIDYPTNVNLEPLKINCKKCGKQSEIYIYNGLLKNIKNIFLCKHCEHKNNWQESSLCDFIQSLNIDFIHAKGSRKIIAPLELDIYIPNKKIAIEYDGLYWHSIENGKNRQYHLKKTQLCESKNIQLIHVFEDEWINKKDIVKSRIKNLLGIYDKTIFARKCIIKEVDSKTSRLFQDENHIQGNATAKLHFGLYFNNELVSLMTFSKPRFNKKYEWELSRFCSKLGYHVVGAAGKLLKYFENTQHPKSLISYADKRWSQGKLYKALGFCFLYNTAPNYFYVKNSIRYNRTKFQKHKLEKLLTNFDMSKSEIVNMRNNGYFRIFDCGNMVFIKQYN